MEANFYTILIIVIALLIAFRQLGARWFRLKIKHGESLAELEVGEKKK